MQHLSKKSTFIGINTIVNSAIIKPDLACIINTNPEPGIHLLVGMDFCATIKIVNSSAGVVFSIMQPTQNKGQAIRD
ncbi:MAG TPA: hypothetical protein VN030_06510 [Cellvibrio sp.]|nr:hypothetical protein [Cellvibrio sp.]